MDKLSAMGLARTKSDQLVETLAAALKSPASSDQGLVASEGSNISRKSSRRAMAASPGHSSSKNTHIRKSRSAQMKFDLEEVSSGAALSRASSASLGLSFSFTGFTMPPDDTADSKPFSDDGDTPEDIEAGNTKKRLQTEPTVPIFLKIKDRKWGMD